MLDAATIAADPRMVAVQAANEQQRAAHEEFLAARVAAVQVTIEEDHHFATKGHHPTGGEPGLCGVCQERIHA